MDNVLYFDGHAQGLLLEGVRNLSDAVTTTMGPEGNLALIERKGLPPHLTKDGATVAKHVFLSDRVQALGADIAKQASENTARIAGDGSTTATLLTYQIYKHALKTIRSGIASPYVVKQTLQKCKDETIEILKSHKREVSSDEEIKQIATVSANGDEYIGGLISEAMSKVGSSGLVTVEKSKTTSTSLELVSGIKIERGYVSPYFCNDEDKMRSVLEDPFVLIVSDKISNLKQIYGVLEKVHQCNKPLLIIANDFDHEAIQGLIVNVSKGLLDVTCIRSPFYGEKRHQVLTDLSKVLDCKVFTNVDDEELENADLSMMGKCKKIEVSNDETIFVDCKSKIENVEEEVKQIELELENPQVTKEEVAFYKQRMIILKGIVAVLSIGAHSDSELLELFDRVDDALHATKSAIESGFLPGGGTALSKAGMLLLEKYQSKNSHDLIESSVAKVFCDACLSPLQTILNNGDLPTDLIIEKIKQSDEWETGYDARNRNYVDMIKEGIIDPFKVTKCALENAVSAACNLISVGCVVLDNNQVYQDVQMVRLDEGME